MSEARAGKVLIAEDSALTRRLVADILRDCGFEVVEASNGEEALERLAECGGASLAVLDWNMPVLDGLETLRALRRDEHFARLPVLMMTTETAKERVIDALEAGANEYLMKPFTREMVAEKLALLGFPTP